MRTHRHTLAPMPVCARLHIYACMPAVAPDSHTCARACDRLYTHMPSPYLRVNPNTYVYNPIPLGLHPYRTAEIKNGRLAMLAITIFAVEEFVTKRPVVEITPLLFTPFPKVVEQLMIQAPALY